MAFGISISNSLSIDRQDQRSGGGGGPTVDLIDNTYSFKFDASSNTHIKIPNFTSGIISEANTNSGLSISLWFQTSSISVNYYLVGSGKNLAGTYTAQASGANPRFSLRDSSSTETTLTTSDGPVSTNVWYHAVYVWDGTASALDRMKIYVNGQQNTSSSVSGPESLQASGSNLSANGLINAYRDAPLNTSSTDIFIDEVGIFSRALSVDDIKLIYDSTNDNPGKTAKLDTLSTGAPYAWYRMGD